MEVILYLFCAALLVSWVLYLTKLFKIPRNIKSKPVNPAAIHYPPYHPRCRGRLSIDINNQDDDSYTTDGRLIFDSDGNLVAVKNKTKGKCDGEKS